MSDDKVPVKLFAFWSYSHFPYLLGAEAIDMYPDGSVSVMGYVGHGRFMPVKFLPPKEGEHLNSQLKKLEKEYKQAQQKLRLEYEDKLKAIAPFALTK